jgi:hypothetical protein
MPAARVLVQRIANCLDCPFHKRITSEYTEYTGDSFDMADEDVICTKVKRKRPIRGAHETVSGRAIVVSERWNLRKQCVVPDWCPLPKPK